MRSSEEDTNDGGATDREARLRLSRQEKGRIWIVDSYGHGGVPARVQSDGYGFSWGQIAERPPDDIMVFDFYLKQAQAAYSGRGRTLVAMQDRVFGELEARLDCTLRENFLSLKRLLQDDDGWLVVPGALGRGMAFSVVCHFGADHFCRGWMIGEFIPDILPQVEEAVRNGLDADA